MTYESSQFHTGLSIPRGAIPRAGRGARHHSIIARAITLIVIASGVLLTTDASCQAAEFLFDSPMYSDPMLASPETVYSFAPELKGLWIEALRRPETELRRQAADAIVEAHRLGMPGLEQTVPELVKLLEEENQHPLVVLTAARALVELDAIQAAAVLEKRLAGGDFELAAIVEPALAKWNAQGLQRIWLGRISELKTSRASLLLAFKGLAAAGRTEAAAQLRESVTAPSTDYSVRLEAARALGILVSTGLEDLARRLASNKSPQGITDRLIAAALLSHHSGDSAQTVLTELATDTEPAVAAAALQALTDLKSTLVLSIAEKSLKHTDANIRRLSIDALAAFPTADRLKLLAERLDDVHPDNRTAVRNILRAQFNDAKYRDLVRELTGGALASESWRAQEQSAILAATIDHEPAADRLAALLDSPRPEVFVAAAWSLRKLSVPSTAIMIQGKLQREGAKIAARAAGRAVPQQADSKIDPQVLRLAQDQQFSQLMQALGEFRFAPADQVCRVCVNRTALIGPETRTAAIWALGHIHAGKPDAELAGKFSSRLSDVQSNTPEDIRVRRMSAVSLGRMKAESGLTDLKRFSAEPSTAGAACIWAIHEITGESLPPLEPVVRPRTGWFLEPIQAGAEKTRAETPPSAETKAK